MRPQLSRAFHNYDPLDNDAFDLVLNTSLLSTEACARIICGQVGRPASLTARRGSPGRRPPAAR